MELRTPPPRILFEDTHLVVLSKPAGLLSQGEKTGDENLVDWLRDYFGRHYVGLIHRLDRNTSGIMIIAKRTKSANRLTTALQEGKVQRIYLAWLVGHLPKEVRWTHYLKKDPIKNLVQVCKNKEQGKESILSAKPIRYHVEKGTQLTLAEFRLETGRSHQIRVQSTYEGFPLLGDQKYAGKAQLNPFHRVALHSYQLEFPHPMSGEILKFEDPLPRDLQLN
jgi:23S rRNA pseudouridine1911/1915/1917 synthase